MSEQTVDTNVPQWDLADRLRKALREADVSVQDMADYLEVSRNTVGSWINGHHRPRPSDLKQWAMRCGVPYRWLSQGTPISSGQTDIPAGISGQPGYAVIDNDITRRRTRVRKRIPLNPMIQLLKAVAA